MVPSIIKAVRILEAVGRKSRPPAQSELATELGIPKSTVHSLCATLAQEGLLVRVADTRYRLGARILDLYYLYDAGMHVTSEFTKVCEELVPRHEETIVLSVLDGKEVVYVSCRSGNQPLAVNYRIGLRLPASCTATGKAILSTFPEDEIQSLFHSGHLASLTKRSITGVGELITDIREVRRRGYSIDDEETVAGMRCVGAPVLAHGGKRAVAAVAFTIVKVQSPRSRWRAVGQEVINLAKVLSDRLGG